MKIAVASNGEGLEAQTSMLFGRCSNFVIVDVENNEIKNAITIQNPAMTQPGGAGIAAAQQIGNQGATAVISGAYGPRAFGILAQLGITPYQATQASVRQNVEMLIQGKLQAISQPTGPMGRGMGGGFGMGGGRGMGGGLGRGGGRGMGGGRRQFQ